jgi:hypothetical protein
MALPVLPTAAAATGSASAIGTVTATGAAAQALSAATIFWNFQYTAAKTAEQYAK